MKSKSSRCIKINRKVSSFFSVFSALFLITILLAPLSLVKASNPATGNLAATTVTSVTWDGTAPGGSSAQGEDPSTCIEGATCDTFALTLSGSQADWSGKRVNVLINWLAPATDYDLYIHKDTVTGTEVSRSAEGPTTQEQAFIDPSVSGTGVFVVHVVYFAATAADQYKGTASVEDKAAAGPAPTPPTVSTAKAPTYTNYPAPASSPLGANSATNLGARAGEPTIGLNWASGKAMFLASLQTLQVTFNDSTGTASWVNKPATNTAITSLDPLLFTDSRTNRTFVSQLAGKASLMSFTDDDGETYTPSQGSGINSGVDHQTIGGGPYAANIPLPGGLPGQLIGPRLAYPNAVYYASQDIGTAEIARSDDGGLTFGVAVPMYDLTQCNGLHGHIKVAPDGTVYVPNKSCGGEQAVVVSTDNGLTWSVRKIPGSTKGHSDPSIGTGSDGTIYVGYSNGDSKARIAVSHDRGLTWENDQDVGYRQNVQNSVFPAVTAGDGDRAAFFFIGTDVPGSGATSDDAGAVPFAGVWYGYISTTYDGGKTWVTVKATPDPVQRGVVCTNGTTCPTGTRNLLDFNDMEVDKQGRPVAALADGCVTSVCKTNADKNGDGVLNNRFDNDGGRLATIIRQTTGKSLFAAYDTAPTVSITTPANNSTFTAGSNVTITASASDADGNVTKVDFYAGTTLIGTSANSPYSFTWNSVAAGNYSLTAKATDNDGKTTTSTAVNITVTVPAAPSNLTATSAQTSGLKKSVAWLKWADNSSDEAGFKIERSTSAAGVFVQIATVGANATAYTDSTVVSRNTYYYRVRAYNSNGANSAYSNTANVFVK